MQLRILRTVALWVAVVLMVAGRQAEAQGGEKVRVGQQLKNAYGTLLGMESGDIACYLTLKDDRGGTFEEMADFDICEKRTLLNKRVALKYELHRIQSPECQGSESCTKSVTVPLVVDARPVAPGR